MVHHLPKRNRTVRNIISPSTVDENAFTVRFVKLLRFRRRLLICSHSPAKTSSKFRILTPRPTPNSMASDLSSLPVPGDASMMLPAADGLDSPTGEGLEDASAH